MSEGHERPPGWATDQPPPYGAPAASPWAAPGQQPGQQPGPQSGQQPAPPVPPMPYGDAPPPAGPAPYGQQQPYYGHQPQPYGPPGHQGGYQHPHAPAMRPGIIPLRPLSLGDVLDGSIKLIRSNPKAVLGLSAITALLVAIPVAISQALLLGPMGSVLTNPYADPQELESSINSGFLSSYGGSILSYLIGFIAVTLLTGVLTRILGRAVFGGRITAGEAWSLLKGRWPALFGVVGLMTLLTIAPLVVLVPLFFVMGGAGMSDGTFLGFMFLALVIYAPYALFVMTRFSFATPAVVLEQRGPVDAMRRSWQLVSGDFWRVLGILLATMLLAGIVSAIIGFPFTLIGTFVGMLGGNTTGSLIVSAIMITLGTMIGGMISYPIQAGVSGLLYTDRRMRSEAFDLVLQTAAIEQQRQGWVHASADDLWHPSNSARQ
ncbi:glycerophosphoryl diester phosphodiesterase membrane domain-containing protein [Nonomuraea sp. NPDC050663]|uniref:glycerophosphoryl diester phosphodiesterase membrane domain-containing protein n=1 Tax=Nonomuraea sp. NPDC050663 TaxID=3364370 RepID=UPI00379D673B